MKFDASGYTANRGYPFAVVGAKHVAAQEGAYTGLMVVDFYWLDKKGKEHKCFDMLRLNTWDDSKEEQYRLIRFLECVGVENIPDRIADEGVFVEALDKYLRAEHTHINRKWNKINGVVYFPYLSTERCEKIPTEFSAAATKAIAKCNKIANKKSMAN